MIYWLTGAIGAGKTTLGAALAASLPDTFFIDGDYLLPDADNYIFEDRIKKTIDLLISKTIELERHA